MPSLIPLRAPFLPTVAAVLGLFYLLPSLVKAYNLIQFKGIIAAFGLAPLAGPVPWLIVPEIGLVVVPLLGVYVRRLTGLRLAQLAVSAALFTYGYLVHGVTIGGCFGALDALCTAALAL